MYEGDISSCIPWMISFEFYMSWKVNVNVNEILLKRTISVLFSCKHTFILYIEKENQGKNTILCCWCIIMSLMSIIGKPFTRPHLSSLSWMGMMWMCRESLGLASDNYHKIQRKNKHFWQFTDVWYSFDNPS